MQRRGMLSRLLTLSALAGAAAAASADEPKNDLYKGGFQYRDMGATPNKDDSLYQAMGGKDKIHAFTKEFVGLIAKDDRIGHYFVNVDLDHLTDMLSDQFIELGGGPVKYEGRDMVEVHSSLGISNADFNRLAETTKTARELYDAMLELHPNRANPGSLWSGANAAKTQA